MKTAYLGLIGLIAAERVFEIFLSNRNLRWALAEGGREVGRGHFPAMVALHALFLPACVLEVWLLDRSFTPAVGGPMLLLVALTMTVRYWAISTLGRRWNTRVVVLPGRPRICDGPYRFMRHPNYLAVVVEIAAVPLVFGAWWTALAFSTGNLLVLRTRLRVEEAALRAADESL